jgi:hypothetical protein
MSQTQTTGEDLLASSDTFNQLLVHIRLWHVLFADR